MLLQKALKGPNIHKDPRTIQSHFLELAVTFHVRKTEVPRLSGKTNKFKHHRW